MDKNTAVYLLDAISKHVYELYAIRFSTFVVPLFPPLPSGGQGIPVPFPSGAQLLPLTSGGFRYPPWLKVLAFYLLDAISKNVYELYAHRFSTFVVPRYRESYGANGLRYLPLLISGTPCLRCPMTSLDIRWLPVPPMVESIHFLSSRCHFKNYVLNVCDHHFSTFVVPLYHESYSYTLPSRGQWSLVPPLTSGTPALRWPMASLDIQWLPAPPMDESVSFLSSRCYFKKCV